MSAFIVGNTHINAMLQAANWSRHSGDGLAYFWDDSYHYFNGNIQAIGQKLMDENYRSVNYRYSEREKPEQFNTAMLRKFSPVEVIKACDCYNYQTCESPDYRQTEAYFIMQALRERAIDCLPGYDDAAWCIYD